MKLGAGRFGSVKSPKYASILASMHAVGQRPFVSDMRRGVIGKAGRGAGKSLGMAAKYDAVSAAHPGCSSVFVTISSERSRDIMLPAVWKLNEKFGLGITERRKDNSLVWPNGYNLKLRGCKDRTEANKRRGTPWVMAGWDECDSLNQALLEYDIHECVEPRLMDYRGTWFACGTPGPIPHGYWYKLSSGDHPEFPLYEWDARNNPHMPALEYFISTLQRMQGVPDRKLWPDGVVSLAGILADPKHWHLLPARFVREYLGKWVMDLKSLIYRVTPKNTYATLPITPDYWTIGVDLGAHSEENPELDHAAFTVACSNRTLPYIWIVESRSMSDITVDGLAAQLCQLLETYPRAAVHLDSASAGKIIENTFRKMGIPIQAALKGPKLRRIQLVQSGLQNGNIQLHIRNTMDLRHESTSLMWSEDRKNHSEKCKDDCWDSALYAVLPHLGDHRPEEEDVKPGSREALEAEELAQFEAALEEAMNDAETDLMLWPDEELWLPLAA